MNLRITVAMSLLCSSTIALADYHVSTETQSRSALLEEYTGIHCIYCPQGHQIAASLLEANPDRVNVVSIHYGQFAVAAYDDQPDFLTEAGNTIGNYYGPSSFPIGMVNRRMYDGRYCIGRTEWEAACQGCFEETTPVNLWSAATYNKDTRVLAVDVEGYITIEDADTAAPIFLSVALTQDSILGPQMGGLMADEYPHNHVLRDYLTPVWGDSLGVCAKGSYIVRHYEYTVPESYKNTEVDPTQLELVTIVSNQQRDVVNSTRVKPVITQYHVSAEPAPRHSVIEEFTGIFCGNCPDGAEVIRRLQLAQPELIHTIAIHSGHYADVSGRDGLPDFVTAVGDEIANYYEVYSYPSGMVNRHSYLSEGVVTGRNIWGVQCRQEAQQTAAMNLWMQSNYVSATRTLSIDVEGYAQETGVYALAIALVQNHIEGYQNGGSANYLHNHALRAYLTPTWGDELGKQESGSYCKMHYEYQVPEIIGNIPVVPEELELVAMVLDENHAVVNAQDCLPESDDFNLPMLVQLEPYKFMPTRNWGFNYVKAYLLNRGIEPITSANFAVSLNDDTVMTPWQGFAPGRTRTEVVLPVNWLQTQEDDINEYQIVLTEANGEAVTADNTVKGSFRDLIEVTGNVNVKIKEDYYASDNRFRLLDSDGNLLQELGPYADSTKQATYEETLLLQPGRIYCFEMTDAWGNGIKSPLGSVKFYDESGALLVNQNDFGGFGYCVCFRTTQQEEGITRVEQDMAPAQTRIVWRNGQLTIDTATGTYTLQGQHIGDR